LEEDPFNPDYVEVDRVLDVAEQSDPNGQTIKHYLVKWRSLQYEECTWELEEDVDPLKIEEFERFRKVPPKDQWKVSRHASKSMKLAGAESESLPLAQGGSITVESL